MNIDISKLNKAEVLAALYNNSKPQGMGILHFDPKDMTIDEAQKLLDFGQTYFDYLKGRIMKINLSRDILNPTMYDVDNGEGSAEKIIDKIKEKNN